MKKNVEFIKGVQLLRMGEQLVRQPFPSTNGELLDPWLLLHHWGPVWIEAGEEGLQVAPHPHRGFMPVTIMLRGEVAHQDSRGNRGIAREGDVQWFNAGMGIIHSERSPQDWLSQGGELELLQLWINLPAEKKMAQPTYDLIRKEKIPSIDLGGNTILHLISGSYQGTEGPTKAHSPLLLGRITAKANDEFSMKIPSGENVIIYVISGHIEMQAEWYAEDHQWATLSEEAEELHIRAIRDSHLLVMAAQPLRDPIAWNGPFVMNTETQLLEAMRDYQMGKMGILVEEKI